MIKLKQNENWYTKEGQIEHNTEFENQTAYGFHQPTNHYSRLYITRGLIDTALTHFLNEHKECSLLDVGCGHGDLAMMISWPIVKVLGIDASEEVLEHTRLRNKGQPKDMIFDRLFCHPNEALKKFKQMYWWDIPSLERTFDVVVATEILEHTHDPKEFLKVVASVSDDWIIITVPNYNITDPEKSHLWTFKTSTLMSMLTEYWNIWTYFEVQDPTARIHDFRYFIGRKRK